MSEFIGKPKSKDEFTPLKRNIKDKYFSEDQPIQIRFFNIVFLGGFIAGLSGICACLMLGSSPLAITIATTFTFYMPIMFILANKFKTHYDVIMIVSFVIMDFIIIPLMYLTGGGVNCGIPSYFVLGIALTMFILKGKIGIILSILDAIFCVLVVMFSYYCNEYVIPLPDETSNFMAISSNAIMVAIVIAAIAKGVFRQYSKEKNAANKLAKKLKDMSVKDPLTTTYNRRFMMDYLQSEMKNTWENNIPLSIVMIDIDKFKNLNDNYGHLVGDEVLVNLSSILKSMCREHDVVSRYGGEEFLLIFPNTDKETAAKRAEEIRIKVQDATLSDELFEDVTISLGVGQYRNGLNCEKFVDIADDNLYKAKNTGRNRVCAD